MFLARASPPKNITHTCEAPTPDLSQSWLPAPLIASGHIPPEELAMSERTRTPGVATPADGEGAHAPGRHRGGLTHNTVPTETVEVGGSRFPYRRSRSG